MDEQNKSLEAKIQELSSAAAEQEQKITKYMRLHERNQDALTNMKDKHDSEIKERDDKLTEYNNNGHIKAQVYKIYEQEEDTEEIKQDNKKIRTQLSDATKQIVDLQKENEKLQKELNSKKDPFSFSNETRLNERKLNAGNIMKSPITEEVSPNDAIRNPENKRIREDSTTMLAELSNVESSYGAKKKTAYTKPSPFSNYITYEAKRSHKAVHHNTLTLNQTPQKKPKLQYDINTGKKISNLQVKTDKTDLSSSMTPRSFNHKLGIKKQ
jgi:hypothetical protein